MADDVLYVTSVGMVSPIGLTAAASCAAARAGITRIRDVEGVYAIDPISQRAEPVTAHFIKGVTDGFTGLGRLARLGEAALRDLLSTMPAIDERRTAILVSLSSDFYRVEAARLATSDDTEPPDPSVRAVDARRRVLEESLLATILRSCRLQIPARYRSVVFSDATGFVEQLAVARRMLSERRITQAIVGAIDSLTEPDILMALERIGVLKSVATNVGFIPGECSVFFGVRLGAVHTPPPGAICALRGDTVGREPTVRQEDNPALGVTMAAVAENSIRASARAGHAVADMIGPLNGDTHRARDFGYALVRLTARDMALDVPWHPAMSFGETGAAAGAIGVAMAATRLQRRWTDYANTAVAIADDAGGRAAVCVTAT